MARVGRPKDIQSRRLGTLDQAVQELWDFFKTPKPPYCKRTLQNKISGKVISRFGPYHQTMVDLDEVLNKLGHKKAS
jgi:hypothetical protein